MGSFRQTDCLFHFAHRSFHTDQNGASNDAMADI
jgi:hypothetical protein